MFLKSLKEVTYNLPNRLILDNSRIIDQNVNFAKLGNGLLYERVDIIERSHIGLYEKGLSTEIFDGLDDFLGLRLGGGGNVVDNYICTFFGQCDSDSRSNSLINVRRKWKLMRHSTDTLKDTCPRGTSDDCDLSIQVRGHIASHTINALGSWF